MCAEWGTLHRRARRRAIGPWPRPFARCVLERVTRRYDGRTTSHQPAKAWTWTRQAAASCQVSGDADMACAPPGDPLHAAASGGNLSSDDLIPLEGKVVEVYPGGKFLVETAPDANGNQMTCEPSTQIEADALRVTTTCVSET